MKYNPSLVISLKEKANSESLKRQAGVICDMGSLIEQDQSPFHSCNESQFSEYEPCLKSTTLAYRTPSNKVNIMNAPGTRERCNISERINYSRTPKVFTD